MTDNVAPVAAPVVTPAATNPAQASGIPYVAPTDPAPAAPAQAAAPTAPVAPTAPAEPPAAPVPPTAPAADPMTLTPPPAYKHEPTGNAAYDIAMTAFAAQGFSPEHPAFDSATKGDFTLLEQFVKERGIDPQYLALAQQAQSQISAHHEATHGATIKQALEYAGGEERWGQVKAWVQQTADPAELKEWATELEAGGKRTLAAAKYLSDLYGQHGEKVVGEKPADPFKSDSSPNIATNGAPLNPQEFRVEMGRLIDKIGYSGLESSPEYAALQKRRLAWRG